MASGKIIGSFGILLITAALIISIFNIYIQKESEIIEDEEIVFSIQQVINKASSGETINVQSGIYYENITIEKPLTIIGENREDTIIDGQGNECVILIKSDDVIIKNFTIRNSGGYKGNSGIKIDSNDNQITNCVIYRTKTGIYLNKVKNNIISNCLLHTNGEGIFSYHSSNSVIKNSQFQHNAFGLNLDNSEETTIKNSYIHTNGIGIYGKESKNTEITQNAICDNGQDGGGVWFFGCEKLDINDCNINHNSIAIRLENTDSTISNCNLHFNMYNTIRMKNVEKTTISNSDIKESYRVTIYLEESNCKLENNNIINSGLNGIESDKESFCNAKNNYWGSITGPSYTLFRKGSEISFRPFKLKTFPWKREPIENSGSKWNEKEEFEKIKIENNRFKPIKFEEKDSDSDGAPDFWEEKWDYDPYIWNDHYNLDPDGDALNNIEECYTDKYGSNPYYKDIFVEVDWLDTKDSEENKPSIEFIKKVQDKFKEQESSLHIDTGNLEGGEKIQKSSISSCADFRDLYWDYFLHNDLDNPRKGIFHYALISDTIDEFYEGFVFVGWDHLDMIGMAMKQISERHKFTKKEQLIVQGITHELGHTMGLFIDDYDGIDNDESGKSSTSLEKVKYRNYKSVMNYRYIYDLFSYSDGSHGREDFNDWENLDFSFFKDTNFEQINLSDNER